MRYEKVQTTHVRTFNDISDLSNYITLTKGNKRMNNQSQKTDTHDGWYGTYRFEDAEHLMRTGDSKIAEKLETELGKIKSAFGIKHVNKNYYDIAGYQASVPRYLQGVPTNMVNSRKVPQKQRVVTLIKSVSYSSFWKADQIIEESVKALAIVHKVESAGVKVNLDVMWFSEVSGERVFYRVNIKKAGERLNVSKIAFPLVHPSMLRRFMFALLEVEELKSPQLWYFGYGTPINDEERITAMLKKNEHVLPHQITDINKAVEALSL